MSDLNHQPRFRYREMLTALAAAVFLRAASLCAQTPAQKPPRSGKELFQAACIACHGPDGRGAPQSQVGFETPLPDFTDCVFTAREPDSDWLAIAHNGGPARGFSPFMPAFGDALDHQEIQSIVSYLRSLCRDNSWPRGDLNLPRPIATEKAFPEDEAVITTAFDTEGSGAVTNVITYEKRFGARNQFEVSVPFNALKMDSAGWRGGVGDLALGYKRALFSSWEKGSIFSVGGEAVLPTGNKTTGLGKGYGTLESFAAFGQILPSDGFLHLQAGIETPRDTSRAAKETFWRAVVGKSFMQEGGLGRAWSPMVEVLGARELETGATAEWDLLPQMQVTLSKRQHIALDVGVRIPMNNAGPRTTQVVFYLMWDWFDGGLRDGW